MAITAAQVKELREMTGAGMMDCKKALTSTDGDMDKAVEFLREKGLATAQKKARMMQSLSFMQLLTTAVLLMFRDMTGSTCILQHVLSEQ